MNLDLFNNLIKSTNENNSIQNFLKDVDEFLKNNLENNEKKQIPLVQKILAGRNLITRYRDEINVQRQDIINKYSKENSKQGEFYYVYNKRTDNTFGIVCYDNGEIVKNIGIKENELPKRGGVDCVLRIEKEKFVLDKIATEKIQKELTEMINKLLEEQNNNLNTKRVEGHLYEFVEKSGNNVFLLDETNYTGECFEETNFPKDLADKIAQGDKLKYIKGEYQLVNN